MVLILLAVFPRFGRKNSKPKKSGTALPKAKKTPPV
jgi:hypothetical protein